MFRRFSMFMERCRDVRGFTELVHQFGKMEKIYIGGTSGAELTSQIREIYEKFTVSAAVFKEVSYDMMDITAAQFDGDFYEFRRSTKALEKRLATVLCKGFDDLTTMHSRFQLLDGFEELLSRPILADELKNKQALLIAEFMEELKALQVQFAAKRAGPPIHANLPPRSGSVSWCRGFKERVVPNMISLRRLAAPDELTEVEVMFTGFTKDVDTFEAECITTWQ